MSNTSEPVFKHCPAYARFLLQNKAEEFALTQIKLLREHNILLPQNADALAEEQLKKAAITSAKELLEALAENKTPQHATTLIALYNQLLQNNSLKTEDIITFGFVLRKTFRDFLLCYASDVNAYVRVMEEIDEFCNNLEALYAETSRRSEISKHQLIQNAPDAVIAVDEASKILVWNPKCEEIFGWKAEEITGMSLTDTIIPPVYRESHRIGMHRLLTTGEARVLNKALELTALNKQGKEFHISLTISKAELEGRNIFIAFIRDISKEKQTQAELENKSKELANLNLFLEQKNIELESTNKELESFNYIISHDLQEPLRKIQVFSSRLASSHYDIGNDERKIIIERINVSAARLNHLVSDLLSFTLLSRAKEDNFELVDLNSLVHEILDDYQMIIDEKNALFYIEKLPEIKGIRLQIYQLFQNLISNAIKYAHPERVLHVHIQSELIEYNELQKITANVLQVFYNKITVKDNGIGFEEQYSEKIFRLFQRLHANDEYSGTGIGLAICKRVIDYHRGFIEVHSKQGEGTSFEIYLPILD